MFRRVAAAGPLLMAALCCLPARARAEPDAPVAGEPGAGERKTRAAGLDRDARAAFAAGEFERAAWLFAQANATLPHPATRYNEAVARQRIGQLAQAADLLESVVGELPEQDPRRKDASMRLVELGPKLARLSVTTRGEATGSVAFVKNRRTPFIVFVEPGSHAVQVTFPGQTGQEQKAVLRAGQLVQLSFEPLPELRERRTLEPPAIDSTRKTWGFVTLGAGAAAGAASGILGYSTLQALDDFERSGNTDAAARDRALRLRTLTNVALGVCAVTSGVGIYLLLSQPKQEQALEVGLGLDGARLRGLF